MRQWDREAVEFGIPDIMLMENASRSAVYLLEELTASIPHKNILVLMGGGNNGGDAICMARILRNHGARVKVAHIKDLSGLKGAALFHTELAKKDGVDFIRLDPLNLDNMRWSLKLANFIPDIVIDGLIGVSLHGALTRELARLIEDINYYVAECRAFMFAIDVPSGLDANTGQAMPRAIEAHATGCMAFAKRGLVLPQARQYTGDLFICDIGMPLDIQRNVKPETRLLDGRLLLNGARALKNSYKNTYGHVLVIGGQNGTSGAAHLAALGALRAGAGLVTVCAPAGSINEVKGMRAEIMTLGIGEGSQWPPILPEELIRLVCHCDSLVIGPGMGRDSDSARFLDAILDLSDRPATVFDADALWHLAQNSHWLERLNGRDVITPHPLEAARLLDMEVGSVEEDRITSHKKLMQKMKAVVVLKGAGTLIGQTGSFSLLCPYDVPQLAAGGSGDVLSGITGAHLVKIYTDVPVMQNVACAVMRHVCAGKILAEKFPDRGCLASDIANTVCHTAPYIESLDKTALNRGLTPWPK